MPNTGSEMMLPFKRHNFITGNYDKSGCVQLKTHKILVFKKLNKEGIN